MLMAVSFISIGLLCFLIAIIRLSRMKRDRLNNPYAVLMRKRIRNSFE
jgi:hypothetical protein